MACGPLKIVDRLHKVDKVVPQLLKGGYAPVAGHHVLDLACIVKDGHAGDESQTIRRPNMLESFITFFLLRITSGTVGSVK